MEPLHDKTAKLQGELIQQAQLKQQLKNPKLTVKDNSTNIDNTPAMGDDCSRDYNKCHDHIKYDSSQNNGDLQFMKQEAAIRKKTIVRKESAIRKHAVRKELARKKTVVRKESAIRKHAVRKKLARKKPSESSIEDILELLTDFSSNGESAEDSDRALQRTLRLRTEDYQQRD